MGLKVRHIDLGACVDRDEWKDPDTHEFVDEDLGHLADVNVPAPGDRYFLSYDSATGLWIARDLYGLLTTRGDLPYRGASVWERLALGGGRQILVSDGTDLNYERFLGKWGLSPESWEWVLDWSNWTSTVTGSGAVTASYGSILCSTGATGSSTARARGYSFGWWGYSSASVEMYFYYVQRGQSANGQVWLKLDTDTSGDPTAGAIGFRIDPGGALKGIVHDDSSLTVVDLNTIFGVDGDGALLMRFIAGDKIYWFVNGVEKGNSSNIPTATRQALVYPIIAAENAADAADTRGDLWKTGWIQLA